MKRERENRRREGNEQNRRQEQKENKERIKTRDIKKRKGRERKRREKRREEKRREEKKEEKKRRGGRQDLNSYLNPGKNPVFWPMTLVFLFIRDIPWKLANLRRTRQTKLWTRGR